MLGEKDFSKAVLHGQWFGPPGAPSAFMTCFEWVLYGEVKNKGQQNLTHVCCVALDNNTWRRSWEVEDQNAWDNLNASVSNELGLACNSLPHSNCGYDASAEL